MLRILLVSLSAAAASAKSTYSQEGPPLNVPPVNAAYLPEPSTPYFFENHNPERTEDGLELWESDIVLTEEQKMDRKAAPNTWPGGIVKYTITSSSAADEAAIRRGLRHWTDTSCVQFQQVPSNYRSGPHLRFVKKTGCWSYLGRINWPGQEISIGPGCTQLGTVAHEIGHALGFNHEQSRTDRDTYVTIRMENILPRYRGNFMIDRNSNNFSVPYDYSSVMHYGRTYFSKNGKPTISANRLSLSSLIGNRAALSHRDQHLANLMYNCASSCTSPPRCKNGGFVTKDCRCKCPPNTRGNRCQSQTGPYYVVCGDQSITTAGNITSLNYPEIYPPGKTCFCVVTAPAGKRVRISFGNVKVIYRSSGGRCVWDYINLYLGEENVYDMNTCGSELKDKTLTSRGRRLAVEMKSYSRGNYPSLQTGFTASVSFV